MMYDLRHLEQEVHMIRPQMRMNMGYDDHYANANPDAQPLNHNVLDQLPKSGFKKSELPANATDAEKSCIVCLS